MCVWLANNEKTIFHIFDASPIREKERLKSIVYAIVRCGSSMGTVCEPTGRYNPLATYAQQFPQSTKRKHKPSISTAPTNKQTKKKGEEHTLKIPYASTAYTPKRAHSPLATTFLQYATERARPHSVPYVPHTALNDVGGCRRSAVYTCLSTSRATDKLYLTGCWYAGEGSEATRSECFFQRV